MSLFDWQDLLDNHQFFLFIDLVKYGISPGNVKPVDDNSVFQNKFFFITLTSRERIFFKPF
jgi:Ni,Fe-hydrogenase maturation factor